MYKIEGEKVSHSYWEGLWKEQRPYTYGLLRRTIQPPTNRRLKLLLKKYLPHGERRVLEIGCAPGRYLVWLNRELGCEVYGIDYSEVGCELTKESLRRNGVKGEIIRGNAFDTSFRKKYEGFFDIVYSLGFIEHFDDPSDALAMHLELLKTDGLLIITVPNYSDGSIYRKWARIMRQEEQLIRTHNVELTKIANFTKNLERFESLKIQRLGYIGPMRLPIRGQYINGLLNVVVGYLTFFLNSETFSPDLILVAKKL